MDGINTRSAVHVISTEVSGSERNEEIFIANTSCHFERSEAEPRNLLTCKPLYNRKPVITSRRVAPFCLSLQKGEFNVPPGVTRQQDTSLLYAGEYFDPAPQMYNNRARWYNPYNGRFNRTDDYAGNTQDPQSLHKYLYVHNNPVNGIDPSGMFFGGITSVISSISISTWTRTKDISVSLYAKYKMMNKARMLAVFANGSINAAINVYSGPESVSRKMRAAIGFTAGAVESWLITYEIMSPWIANSIGAAIQSTANEAASSDEFFTRKTLRNIASTVVINGLASAALQGYDGGAKEEIEKFLIVLDLNLWTGLWQRALDTF